MNLRDTIARAIYGSIHPIGGWGTWVDEGGDSPYHAHADAVLAALGLDDLDAAVARFIDTSPPLRDALTLAESVGGEYPAFVRAEVHRALLAALTPKASDG